MTVDGTSVVAGLAGDTCGVGEEQAAVKTIINTKPINQFAPTLLLMVLDLFDFVLNISILLWDCEYFADAHILSIVRKQNLTFPAKRIN